MHQVTTYNLYLHSCFKDVFEGPKNCHEHSFRKNIDIYTNFKFINVYYLKKNVFNQFSIHVCTCITYNINVIEKKLTRSINSHFYANFSIVNRIL